MKLSAMRVYTRSLLFFLTSVSLKTDGKRVAIIGGGVAGSFSAKYLADYDTNCTLESITMFDPKPIGEHTTVDQEGDADWQGSRMASLKLKDGMVVELGASVAIKDFRLVVKMLQGDASLEIGAPHTTGKEDATKRGGLGIYDGNGVWMLLTSNTPSILSKLKMMWRYNIDLYTMSRAARTAEIGLARIHSWLGSAYPTTFFESPDEMWNAAGLLKPTHMSFDAFLDAVGLSEELPWWRMYLPYQGSLRAELLTAINLCNYNQANSQVNGLVGLGSFISAKVELFSIAGGNCQVIKSAFHQAKAKHYEICKSHANSAIQHVAKQVTSVVGDLEGMELFSDTQSLGQFDVVILAAPIQQSRIAFFIRSDKDPAVLHDMPLSFSSIADLDEMEVEDLHNVPPTKLPESLTRPYTQVVTTVLTHATLKAGHFYLTPQELPQGIYMTEQGKEKEYNITAIGQIASDVYKIFSSDRLNETSLNVMFEPGYDVEYEKVWGGLFGGATPDYRGEGKTVKYLLYDSSSGVEGYMGGALYYPNAVEASFACMELSAIGAKSVAKLVARRLGLLVPEETRAQEDEL